MARYELKLPAMGESIAEATITNWLKQVGDFIDADETVVDSPALVPTMTIDTRDPNGLLVMEIDPA
jgi:hypothetical protein